MVLRHLCQDIVGLQDLHQGRHHPSQLWMYVVRQWEAVEESEACNMELRIPDGRDQFQHLDGVFLVGGGSGRGDEEGRVCLYVVIPNTIPTSAFTLPYPYL